MEDTPAAAVLVAEQRVETIVAVGQCSHRGQDYFVGNGDRPALALLGDVVKHHAVTRHRDVSLLQRGGAVMMVQLGIFFAADPEQAEVDQPDGAGRDAVTIQTNSRQVLHSGRPQRRQNAGEPQHVKELLGVALFAPLLVVAVLGPAPAVHAGGLDVPQRVRRDPDVRPGRWDRQRADALQRLPLRDLRA